MGGAIPQSVQKVDLDQVDLIQVNRPRLPHDFDLSSIELKYGQSYASETPPILVETVPLPWFQTITRPHYSEEFLLKDLVKTVQTDGIATHHPEIRKVIYDSFQDFPDLQEHYLASSAR